MTSSFLAAQSMIPGWSKAELAPIIREEADGIETQLTQARDLLRDGMNKLYGSFAEMRDATEAYQALAIRFMAARDDAAEQEQVGRELEALRESLRERADKALMGFQIEDMVSQLVEQIRQRSCALAALAAALGEDIDGPAARVDSARKKELFGLLTALQRASAGTTVTQASADAGDVELF